MKKGNKRHAVINNQIVSIQILKVGLIFIKVTYKERTYDDYGKLIEQYKVKHIPRWKIL